MGSIQKLKSDEPGDEALKFFDLGGIGEACVENKYDQKEFMSKVIEDMRCGDPKVSQRAQIFWWQILKDSATLSGAIGTSKVERTEKDERGRSTKVIVTSAGLVQRLSKENPYDSERVSPHRVLPPSPVDEVFRPEEDAGGGQLEDGAEDGSGGGGEVCE